METIWIRWNDAKWKNKTPEGQMTMYGYPNPTRSKSVNVEE